MKKPILDTDSIHPLYQQLIQKLRMDIAAGLYPAHSRIPSEQELCTQYSVSRVTVRKALSEMTREGILARHQGKGTFVSAPKLRRDLRSINSFNDTCRDMGIVPESQVLRVQHTPADEMDQQAGLAGTVLEIVRVRLADGVPVMLETNHFSEDYDWLASGDLTSSLYAQLHSRGVEPGMASHEISLIYADTAEARHLGVEPGTALLSLNEMVYDQRGGILHTSRQKIRGDRFTFRI